MNLPFTIPSDEEQAGLSSCSSQSMSTWKTVLITRPGRRGVWNETGERPEYPTGRTTPQRAKPPQPLNSSSTRNHTCTSRRSVAMSSWTS